MRQRLNIGLKRGKVRFTGLVNLTGREEKQWARWNVPKGKEQHEAEILELCLAAHKATVLRRGPHVGKYHPDAEAEIDGHTFLMERDRSTIGTGDVLKRIIEVYEGCPHDVLWVFETNTRIETLFAVARQWPFDIPPNHWFTTYPEAVTNFHSRIWRNAQGDTTDV